MEQYQRERRRQDYEDFMKKTTEEPEPVDSDSDSDVEPLVIDPVSETIFIPTSLERGDSIESSTWSCHILSIIDMVWTGIEVFLILLCILPTYDTTWQVAVVCILPNTIQFMAAILMFQKTKEVEDFDFEKIYHGCKLWLFLAFVTIVCNTGIIIWVTVTHVITVFLIFVMILKICWRFTAIFFVNEVHNELASNELFTSAGSESEDCSQSQIRHHQSLIGHFPSDSRDDSNLLANEFNQFNEYYVYDGDNTPGPGPGFNDDSGTNGNGSFSGSGRSSSTGSNDNAVGS